MKTAELTGAALDWAVAKCEGPHSFAFCYLTASGNALRYLDEAPQQTWEPSTDWSQGGPIIERERIGIGCLGSSPIYKNPWIAARAEDTQDMAGPTPLVAAMRCYVASKLGDEIEIPEELV